MLQLVRDWMSWSVSGATESKMPVVRVMLRLRFRRLDPLIPYFLPDLARAHGAPPGLSRGASRGLDVDYRERPFWRTALWEATWKNHEARFGPSRRHGRVVLKPSV